jgi:2-polyprenyl-3-methyl-5-hydroxy-6-metoxy-1,4-benzoquinol methylase
MTVPAWGLSAERYEQMYLDAARQSGQTDWGSPVLPFVAPGGRVLDVGCATGWQARLLVERGCQVVGVEVDATAASRAAIWCEEVIVCDLDSADLRDELRSAPFDTIVAGDVLEHLRDPARTLRQLRTMLQPTGQIVASVPNVAHGSVRLALLSGQFPYAEAGLLDRTHLRFFTLSSLRQTFEESGYILDRVERTYVPIDQATPYDRDLLPKGLEQLVASMPEATTFQYVIVAHPDSSSSTDEVATSEYVGPVAVTTDSSELLRAQDRTILEMNRALALMDTQLRAAALIPGSSRIRNLIRGRPLRGR